jgi:hypothetical protein
MTKFALTLEIPVALPDDLDIETVNAVAEDADFRAAIGGIASSLLIATATTWMERAKAPPKPLLVREATKRIHLVLSDCLEATGFGRNRSTVIDALIEEVLDIHQQGEAAIARENYVLALCWAEIGESKIKEIQKLAR